jgi:tRNA dimethylallyltransferase
MAVAAVREARKAGRVPILCGGTGLYLKALIEGLSPVPEIPTTVRKSVRERYAAAETAEIVRALQQADPAAAARLRATDRQRLLRALEVIEATGRSIVDWQAMPPAGPPPGAEFCTILLMPPRGSLYADCDSRFRRMVEQGALAEVEHLAGLGLDPELPAMKALGVAEILRYRTGDIDLEAAIAAAQQATRNYVKRQFTWFSRQIISDLCAEEKFSEILQAQIFAFICKKGLTRLR